MPLEPNASWCCSVPGLGRLESFRKGFARFSSCSVGRYRYLYLCDVPATVSLLGMTHFGPSGLAAIGGIGHGMMSRLAEHGWNQEPKTTKCLGPTRYSHNMFEAIVKSQSCCGLLFSAAITAVNGSTPPSSVEPARVRSASFGWGWVGMGTGPR